LTQGLEVEAGDVDGAIRMAEASYPEAEPELALQDMPLAPKLQRNQNRDARIVVRRRVLTPRSPTQIVYINALLHTSMVFALGPAGTGKTYLAVARAVAALLDGEVDRIILSRPAVEAGENLGFLPGDMKDKVDPYLRPLYDALYDLLPPEQVERRIQSGEIEIAPLAFMRGRTLSNAFVILDEAQNTTKMQMKMLLTRFGQNARMVIAGDPSQVDLPPRTPSGMLEAVNILDGVEDITMVRFKNEDVVRHPLVGRIVDAYDAHVVQNKK
jgi:phosphate starvation-inducible PhoH-like protein